MLLMKRNDEKTQRRNRGGLLLAAYLLAIALCVGGCGKDPAATAEPVTASPTPAASVQEATTTLSETTPTVPEPATTVPEPITTASEPATVSESTTVAPESIAADLESQEFVRRRGGEPNGEIINLVPLSEMPYERPDIEGLFVDMENLAEEVKTATDVQIIVNAYKDIHERMTHVQTLYALAEFRYSQDVTDSYYSDEYDYLSAQSVVMDHKHNELLYAMAASPLRAGLESAYFGRRYFVYNGKDQSESYRELTRREEELLDQYRDMRAAQIESESEEAGDGAKAAYVQAYHEPLGQLYLELVKVRHQIALSLGYENYQSYAFKGIYYRDYSTARAGEFFERVKTYLVPVLKALYEQDPELNQIAFPASLREDPIGHLASAAEGMGGIIWEAYRFMEAYDLCDAEKSPTKRRTGYTEYLKEYETPIIFLNPTLFVDALSLPHEFGHFVDIYLNYRHKGPNEIGEALSTAMEYLATAYDSSLDQENRTAGLRAVLASKVIEYIGWQSAYADFEARVYEEDPKDLTLEGLDEMYYQCLQDYGLQTSYTEEVARGSWIRVRHFFEYPEYVLAYSVANIVSLQIIRLEANDPGAGLEAFCRLLERSPWAGVDIIAKNAKLQSPFASETLEKLAAFLREELDLP